MFFVKQVPLYIDKSFIFLTEKKKWMSYLYKRI